MGLACVGFHSRPRVKANPPASPRVPLEMNRRDLRLILSSSPSVSKKHGKLITFLRTFMKSRPTKQKLKQRGILRERVFGCDLGEHLLNSGHDGEKHP